MAGPDRALSIGGMMGPMTEIRTEPAPRVTAGTWLLRLLLAVVLLAPSRWLATTGHAWWLLATVPATFVVFFVVVGATGRHRA